jgi:hypothetical protein
MGNKKEDIKRELNVLIKDAYDILMAEIEELQPQNQASSNSKTNEEWTMITTKSTKKQPIVIAYNAWYSKALPFIRQLAPERYKEFQELYILEKRDIVNITFLNYTISDYLLGLRIIQGGKEVVNPLIAFSSKFQQQNSILAGANERIDSILIDIKGVLQAELFDDELDAADNLLKNGYFRASGALAGVTIERHLGQVAENHIIKLSKKNPTIADFCDKFKDEGILDIPNWRFLQRLSDIRNLCAHKKERDPTKDEVEELLEGTRKIIKTLY